MKFQTNKLYILAKWKDSKYETAKNAIDEKKFRRLLDKTTEYLMSQELYQR